MRPIAGDPLTGQLPRTRLVIATPRSKVQLETWPLKPDVDYVTLRLLQPGNIAAVRTRFGVRQRLIRVIHHRRGRRFFVGCNRRGWCWPYWVSAIISIEQRQRRQLTR
jgi:hypothetical protein